MEVAEKDELDASAHEAPRSLRGEESEESERARWRESEGSVGSVGRRPASERPCVRSLSGGRLGIGLARVVEEASRSL